MNVRGNRFFRPVFARAASIRASRRAEKAATAEHLNIVLEADEALNLARHLIQGARVAKELTVRVARKPAIKTERHAVSVTYETGKKK